MLLALIINLDKQFCPILYPIVQIWSLPLQFPKDFNRGC